MQLKHLNVENFRGIRSMNWNVNGNLIGLVGPGDSTKTTILDAIDFALSSKWSLPLSDSDFYGGEFVSPIIIEVTIGDLPSELIKEDKFGLYLRGWKPDKCLQDEPDEDCQIVLTIRLCVTKDLEQTWVVITDRHTDGKPISWKDRARLGVTRLGSEVDRDLAWGRGSSLSRLTGDVDVESVLVDAYRVARNAVSEEQMERLVTAAKKAAEAARRFGATQAKDFKPALDAGAISVQLGALSLHDGSIPVRSAGLGTRRLVALAIQQAIVPEGAILLIDEIEHALEPHRIRRLIRYLRMITGTGEKNQPNATPKGQVLMTTHSSVTVVELNTSELGIVRSNHGETSVLTPEQNLQDIFRAAPEALLGRKIVVCEGPTEIGLCWGIEEGWQDTHSGESTACRGVVFINGEGANASKRARELAGLGYNVAFFADSDCEINPTAEELTSAGVLVIRWDDLLCTEQRIFLDLPWDSLQQVVNLVIDDQGIERIISVISQELEQDASSLSSDMNTWLRPDISEENIRDALGTTAKKSKWFKRYDKAKLLAPIILPVLSQIKQTDLFKKLKSLEDWCYV